MTHFDDVTAVLSDMDGVLVHGARIIPGAPEFLNRLRTSGRRFLVLTNNSMYTQRDLQARLARIGLDLQPSEIYTSALATAKFLDTQRPDGTAFVIGEAGLTNALYDVGYTLTEHDPDYVVIGETMAYSFEKITQAVRLVAAGARLIATNPDVSGPTETGMVPACGAVVALIQAATGAQAYFVGKPNPVMMRTALRTIDAHGAEAMMIGDRMDTDIIGGTEAGMRTALVLTGVSTRESAERFPYRPTAIVDSVADLFRA
ncbi:MAG: HAD family hydrolase [Herpetosiphon sp.]|nr:HAD family hydrolase [Herpetosiphon sp.]